MPNKVHDSTVKTYILVLLILNLFIFSRYAVAATKTPITEQSWRLRLLPFPHQMQCYGEVAVDVQKLVLLTPSLPSSVLVGAVEDISAEITRLCGREPMVAVKCPANAAYILQFSKNAKSDSQLPPGAAKPQGYQIVPLPSSEVPGLALMGYDSAGVLYAAQTLRQMLRTNDKHQLLIPQVNIIDAPDMEDRGYFLDVRREPKTWNDLEDWKRHIDWAASQRFNVILVQIGAGGRLIYPSAAFPESVDTTNPLSKPAMLHNIIEYGRRHAVRIVPTIPHPTCFEQLWKDHPDTMMSIKGRKTWGGAVIEDDRQVVDFGKPETVEVIRRFFADLIEQTQPDELSVWPTEAPWYTAEESLVQAQVFYEAFTAAAGKDSTKVLRMLTTPTTLHTPEEMFRRLPPTVKIDYYDSMGTYTLRGIKFRPRVINAMRNGDFHFSTMPMFGRFFWQGVPIVMAELARSNVIASAKQGACGLVANGGDQPTTFALNYAAGAEFAWNLYGRTVPEFIQAWALRQGWSQPKRVADFYLKLEKASIPMTLATPGEGFLPEPLSKLQERMKATLPAKRRKNFIEPLQKAVTEAKAALAKAEVIGHERFKIEAQVILSMSRALLALHQGFAARDEDSARVREFFLEAQKQFRHLEQYWPKLQKLNPGTTPKGPMAGYRRDLPEFLASLAK